MDRTEKNHQRLSIISACKNSERKLPWHHLTKRLVAHVSPIVAPLPFFPLPIVDATDPLVASIRIRSLKVFPQNPVDAFVWLGEPTVSILALKVGVQPIDAVLRDEVAFVADANEMRWTQGVHALGPLVLTGCTLHRQENDN